MLRYIGKEDDAKLLINMANHLYMLGIIYESDLKEIPLDVK